jgi:hypothetical protein
MIKTQIQLPDDLYHKVKKFAAAREWSLAETFRRSIEEMFQRYPSEFTPPAEWSPPSPRVLGCRPLNNDELKRLAQDDD